MAGSKLKNWKTVPMLSRRNAVSASSSSMEVTRPCSSIVPDVGRSMQPTRFNSVLFPQPLGPTSATSSPDRTSNETPSSAGTGSFQVPS